MSKNKKTSRYLHLHKIPFVLLWMATYAMGWAGALLLIMLLTLLMEPFPVISRLFEDNLALLGALVGGFVGMVTAWGQPWLVRQRSGLVLRLWRPLTIISYSIAGMLLLPTVDYNAGFGANLIGHMAWFLLPAALLMFSLRQVVRGAWQWLAAGAIAAALAAVSYAGISTTEPYMSWHPFGMLIGTLAGSGISAWVMLRLLNRSRVDAQLNVAATQADEAVSDDTTRGYLHATPYMMLWLMTQGVGWMFVVLAFLLLGMAALLISPLENIFYDLLETPVLLMAGMGLVYGMFSAWAQPWLVKLRTGKVLQHWRPLTIFTTTLAALPLGWVWWQSITADVTITAVTTAVAIWFLAPTVGQMFILHGKGRNTWLWPLAGFTSAAIAVMLYNQMAILIDARSYDLVGLAFMALGFGQVVNVLLTGFMSLNILEAPQDEDDEDHSITATAASNTIVQDDDVPLALLAAAAESAHQRL